MAINKFTFKDTIIEREMRELSSKHDSVGMMDCGGNINSPILRRSVYCEGKLVESFDFDSIEDPFNKEFERFKKKYVC